jgi:hypothetical protein
MTVPDESTIIDALYEENKALTDYLSEAEEPSFQTQADEKFRKVLILSAASFFEVRVLKAIVDAARAAAPQAPHMVEFVKKKGLSRQYHTLFDWDRRNANRFFSFFGDEKKEQMKKLVAEDDDLSSSIAAFLELGSLRNELVHLDFANFSLEKTADEIYELYRKASRFVAEIPQLLAPI